MGDQTEVRAVLERQDDGQLVLVDAAGGKTTLAPGQPLEMWPGLGRWMAGHVVFDPDLGPCLLCAQPRPPYQVAVPLHAGNEVRIPTLGRSVGRSR